MKRLHSLLFFCLASFISLSPVSLAADAPNGYQSEGDYAIWKQRYLATQEQPFLDPVSANGYSNGRMYNDFLEYVVGSNGRFTIGTTGGNPNTSTDNYKMLLYGHPTPSTSYTTVIVDSSGYYYTPNAQSPTPDAAQLKNTSEQAVGNVRIKQTITLQTNPNTKRQDTVEMKYVVTNRDSQAHNVGLRIMLDTMLGDNDAAPFRVPGLGAVTSERELTGSDIPEYWQVFDSLTNPSVIAQGTLRDSGSNPPNKVQFVNWERVYEKGWDYRINTAYANGDSAVTMTWNIKSLAAGETREYVTYYGLADFSQDLRPPLAVNLTGASQIDVTASGYNPNPFTATAYIQNVGSTTAQNVRATINLPEGLELESGQQPTVTIGNVTVGQEKQLSWRIKVNPSGSDRELTYSVTLQGDNADTKTVTRNLTVPAYLGIPDPPNGSIFPPLLATTAGTNLLLPSPLPLVMKHLA